MTRRIPELLYDEVFTLVTAIAQPLTPSSEQVDEAMASDALANLVALYRRRESAGEPDPFLPKHWPISLWIMTRRFASIN